MRLYGLEDAIREFDAADLRHVRRDDRARPRPPRARSTSRSRATPTAARSRASRPTSSWPATTSRCAASSSARRGSRRPGPDVEVLAEVDGEPVLAREGRVLVAVVPPGADRRHARPRAVPEPRTGGERVSGHSKWIVDQAQEGRRRRQARQALLEALARDHRGGAGGRARSGREPRARERDREGALATRCRRTTSSARSRAAPAPTPTPTAYETVVYEGYGPSGVAVIVEALTDNRNRTAAEVRARLRQERRQPRRLGRGRVAVRAARLVLVDADRRRRGRADAGRGRGRGRGRRARRLELPGHLRAGGRSTARARGDRGGRLRGRVGRADDAPEDDGQPSTTRARRRRSCA